MELQAKLLACIFLLDVLCSHRKTDDFRPMARCWNCPHYFEFMRRMEKEDEEVMDEIDKIHKFGYPKSFGESES